MARISDIAPDRTITGEELARMPGTDLCELVDGRIVPMTPTGEEHGRIEGNVYRAIDSWVRPRQLGKVLVGEVGIYTRRNPDSVRAADVLFISTDRYARRSAPSGFLDVAPELVVEILSPRDTVMALTGKLREYFAIGVTLVWVIDPAARRVYAYRAITDVREYAETDRLRADEVLPGFEIPVASLFEE
jgi:Uma2 family endonuclease